MLNGEGNFEKLLGAEIPEAQFRLPGADQDVAGEDLVVHDHRINVGALVEHILGVYVHVAELYARSLHYNYIR